MKLIIVTGLAGAGKSTALKILEDIGYFCVDNLPPVMLLQLITVQLENNLSQNIAVGIDTRNLNLLKQLPNVINQLRQSGILIDVIYLQARMEILIKRFSETRRRHPLASGDFALDDCIKKEQNILEDLNIKANRLDTSDLNANTLKNVVKQIVGIDLTKLNIVVQSFGFKYGVPIDSDFLFDVRCLPNPYYIDKIKSYNGNEKPIIDFMLLEPKVAIMIDDIFKFFKNWLNDYNLENRSYLTISIGCTGGKHRSVYIANQLALLIKSLTYQVVIRHRNLLNNYS
jgi:UPF0042 nucleotide-binding protein